MLYVCEIYSNVIQLKLHIHPLFFILCFHIGYYRVLKRFPCGIDLVVAYLLYYVYTHTHPEIRCISEYVLIKNFSFVSPLALLPFGESKFVS